MVTGQVFNPSQLSNHCHVKVVEWKYLVADTLARRQERHEQHFQTHEGSVEAKRCKNWILRRVQVSHFD